MESGEQREAVSEKVMLIIWIELFAVMVPSMLVISLRATIHRELLMSVALVGAVALSFTYGNVWASSWWTKGTRISRMCGLALAAAMAALGPALYWVTNLPGWLAFLVVWTVLMLVPFWLGRKARSLAQRSA